MALEELEGETYALHITRDDYSPQVYIPVNGVKTHFVVDTGCLCTKVAPKQVEEWGLKDEITPSGKSSWVTTHFDVLGGSMWPVHVKDIPWNLLGLDLLSMYNCVIDLENGELTFRKIKLLSRFPECIIRTFNINGKDMEVLLDTGQEEFLVGGLQHAEETGLQVDDMSVQGLNMQTPNGNLPIQFKVPDVCLRGYGKERKCTLYACPD